MKRIACAVVVGVSLVTVAGSEGVAAEIKPAADAPQPMTPAESARKIRLPNGFRIDLVASEPLVQDPSCIAFDERGRLFVCELHGYNIEGHIDVKELNKTGELDMKVRRIRWELQGGKIAEEAAKLQYGVVKLLTDTDGDGVMDQADVWADDLPPCYGVLPARGGVIVVCAPHIMFFADRDGDGKPEVRETLFTGFRTRVLERSINNPRWGLDNWIYVGGGGDGGTITGPKLAEPVELPHTDFRIKADGSAIEPVSGRAGTFGMTMNDVGNRFPSTGGRPAMYALPLPHRYLSRNPHVATPEVNYYAASYNRGYRISQPHPWRVKRREDPEWVKFYGERETDSNFFSGGCSNTFYGDTLFPEQYRGNIFYCEPSLNMVHRCVVTRNGAGFKGERAAGEQESEFLASTDQWFRPMNLRIGPDGAMYIVDMYREIVEDYSAIPRYLQQQYGLDKGGEHGRIWRLAPESKERRPIDDMSQYTADQLVTAIVGDSFWRRLTAQRLLIERKAIAAAEGLREVVVNDTPGTACIHALHALDGLGELKSTEVAMSLTHEHYGVRIHALRLADRWLDTDDALFTEVLSMSDDADPSVRLQVAMTLGESTDPRAAAALATLARGHGAERWMSAAILSSCERHGGSLLIHLLKQPNRTTGEQALLQPLAATVASQRDGVHMSLALALARSDDAAAEACLTGFVEGLSRGQEPLPEASDGWAGVTRLLASKAVAVRGLATQLAAKLPVANEDQLNKIFAEAVRQASNEDATVDERRQAVQVLASAPYRTQTLAAVPLLDTSQAPALQLAAIETLGASADERVGGVLLAKWPSFTPQVRQAALQTVFARSNRLSSLLDAVEAGTVARSNVTAIQREQLTAARDQELASRAKALFANPSASAELQRRIDRYQAALSGKRDVERGKQVFIKHCLACHKLGKEGHEVGPPLGSIVNKPDETILLDLLDPSGRIEPEYRSYLVTTTDGRTFTGVLVSESATSVTLRKEKGMTESILRREIDVMQASAVSLMPSNLHEQIPPQHAADLLGFLRRAFRREKQQAGK